MLKFNKEQKNLIAKFVDANNGQIAKSQLTIQMIANIDRSKQTKLENEVLNTLLKVEEEILNVSRKNNELLINLFKKYTTNERHN